MGPSSPWYGNLVVSDGLFTAWSIQSTHHGYRSYGDRHGIKQRQSVEVKKLLPLKIQFQKSTVHTGTFIQIDRQTITCQSPNAPRRIMQMRMIGGVACQKEARIAWSEH
jgi:hypothetical protein